MRCLKDVDVVALEGGKRREGGGKEEAPEEEAVVTEYEDSGVGDKGACSDVNGVVDCG